MRKFNKVIVVLALIVAIQAIFCIRAIAAESKLSFNGESQVEAGKEQTISIKVTNDEEIGVIQGKISGDQNIEIVNVEAKDKNWVVNYNSATKQFDGYFADGTKNGDVINVKYKLKEGATQGTITVSEVALTTISYNTIENEKIQKTITAKFGGSNNDGDKKDDKKDSNDGGTGSSSSGGANSKSQNSSNGIIPNLGQSGLILIGIGVSVLIASTSFGKLIRRKNRRD